MTPILLPAPPKKQQKISIQKALKVRFNDSTFNASWPLIDGSLSEVARGTGELVCKPGL